ncbi:MAG: hypothetical protein ACYC6N_28050 [Pirellulaceae bacterium]
MIVASCPACRENVTVPIDARPTSIVRCPLCNAEFHLADFLAQLPPPLIVVEDTRVAGQEFQSERLVDTPGAWGEESIAIDTGAERDASGLIPAFDFTPGSASDDASATPREAPRRPPRRQKQVGWEIAKIVGGALLAVPAAQLILWWFVPFHWKRDLLGIGPGISRVVPWVVPPKFRDTWDVDAIDSAGRTADERRVASPAKRPQSPRDDRSTVRPTFGAGRSERRASPATPPRESAAAVQSDEDPSPTTRPKAVAPRGTIPAAARETAPDHEQPTGQASQSPATPTAPLTQGIPKYGAADLQQALEQALQASVSWDTALDQSEAHQASLREEFYEAFAHLGAVLAFMRPDEGNVRELAAAVRDLLLSFAQQPKKLVTIGNRSSDWLDQSSRPNHGILLFGTVKQIQPEGQLYATELELASLKKRSVTVVSRLDPQPFYAPGDRILMLGALIPPPAEQGSAPERPAQAVILGSFPIRLPQ